MFSTGLKIKKYLLQNQKVPNKFQVQKFTAVQVEISEGSWNCLSASMIYCKLIRPKPTHSLLVPFNTATTFNQGDSDLLTEKKHTPSVARPSVLHKNTTLKQVFTQI